MEPFFVTEKENKDLEQALNSKSTEKYRNSTVKFQNQQSPGDDRKNLIIQTESDSQSYFMMQPFFMES